MDNYLWYTYRENSWNGFDVHGFKEQVGGVLDGQTLKSYLGSFDTVEQALAAYPTAEPGSKWTDPQVSLSHLSDREGYSDDYED